MRYVGTAGGPSVTALVTLVQQLSRDLCAPVLLKLTLSSDSHKLQCMKLQHFQFERGQNLPFDWPASVSNILTVRKWAEPTIVGRNFTSRIRPLHH